MGPTGSGKSDVAERVARSSGCRIINADAFQVYRGFDIGTNKPKHKDLYDLIDILEPTEPYSVGRFFAEATQLCKAYENAGRSVVVCGGTGLYVRALFETYAEMQPTNPILRKELQNEVKNLGVHGMLRQRQIDRSTLPPDSLANERRLVRSVEKLLTPSTASAAPCNMRRLKFAIEVDKEELTKRLRNRILKMVQNGWVEEVARLVDSGASADWPAMQAIGYRELTAVVLSESTLEEATEKIAIRTAQYAKRQMTWLRKEPNVIWLPGSVSSDELAAHILKRSGGEKEAYGQIH
jgi:tRNA dimethylallyltransferase